MPIINRFVCSSNMKLYILTNYVRKFITAIKATIEALELSINVFFSKLINHILATFRRKASFVGLRSKGVACAQRSTTLRLTKTIFYFAYLFQCSTNMMYLFYPLKWLKIMNLKKNYEISFFCE